MKRPFVIKAVRRRRPVLAWLAAVALLINALAPAALSAAITGAPIAGDGFCGAAPPSDPGSTPALPATRHCIYCFAAAIGPHPTPPAAAAAPQFAGPAALAAALRTAPQRTARLAAAQPRGPPGAA